MATGDILSAAVEANGWVAAIKVQGSVGSFVTTDSIANNNANFSNYPSAAVVSYGSKLLSMLGTYSFVVIGQSNGYVQSAGTAVASSTVSRTFIGTKPLRKPVEATAAGVRNAKRVDETDNGDGTFTVRIALSQHVYSTDANLSLTVLAGWRVGSPAQTIAVTNGSTIIAPQPIVRWSDVPIQIQEGSFNLEVVVASLHPVGLQPVAGVRFTVTDTSGVVRKSYWATSVSDSAGTYTSGGSGAAARPVRVYQVTVDPATATALTKGVLRCDYEVYPWVGTVRVSDTAGTKSMTGVIAAAVSAGAQVPFVVVYNPGKTYITPRYAYVVADGSGAATASASLVSTVAATAAATPCNSINIAVESLRLHAVANTSVGTLPAANEQASSAQSVDGCIIRLKAGTGVHLGVGTLAVTSGLQNNYSWVFVEGDPADSNPRVNVVLRAPSSNGGSRWGRVCFRNMSHETGTTGMTSIASASAFWLDNTECRAISGNEFAATLVPFSATGGHWFTNSRYWKTLSALAKSGSTQLPVLVRNCEVERAMIAPVILNNRRLSTSVAGQAAVGADTATTLANGLDRFVMGNDLRYVASFNTVNYSQLANALAPAAPAPGNAMGTTFPVVARNAIVNNIMELTGTTFPMMLPIGENNPAVLTENILENNTFVGDRLNIDYNDLNMATVALNDSTDSIALNNRRANNVGMKIAIKHDRFADGAVTVQRVGVSLASTRNKAYAVGVQVTIAGSPASIYESTASTGNTASTGGPTGTGTAIVDGGVTWKFIANETRQHGYRPNALSAWSSLYGVNGHGNIDMQSADDPNADYEFSYEFIGLGSLQLSTEGVVISATPFTNDKSGTTNKLSYQTVPDGTMGGDYTPLRTVSGNYIIGRGRNSNSDVDMAGVARGAVFSAGAFEPLPAVVVGGFNFMLLGVG